MRPRSHLVPSWRAWRYKRNSPHELSGTLRQSDEATCRDLGGAHGSAAEQHDEQQQRQQGAPAAELQHVRGQR